MQGLGDIMHPEEIKEMIRKLCEIKIEDYASPLWFKQDESLQKLNMQVHASALMKNDEFLLNELLVEEKFQILIADLISTSVWKKRILPLIKPSYS